MWLLFIECIDDGLPFGDAIMWLLFIDDELFIECMADGLGFGDDIESAIAGAAVINAAARIVMK
ncbi:MAG TPA: hypothetical protein VMG98_13435 [Verrucomicrobiae bacterium]|nr:hypothetical protein [Verrucomicrobiae bacterium]